MPKWSNDYEIKKNRSSLLHRNDLWSPNTDFIHQKIKVHIFCYK